ncbi:uncharacterized protein LOC142784615 [Rhipicephalus microplus]|uniref:uncharacterized protein LOC142784615 n=1 Tax=Rhipicephalus microplus TaxID=6941 RepID=UPI003F6D5D11
MPRTHQAPQGAAASSSASKTAYCQHSLAHRGRLANEPVNLYVASAWPLPNGSPHGLEDSEKDRLGHFWAQVLEKPDTALLLSPSRQRPRVADGGRADKKTSKCSSTNIKGIPASPLSYYWRRRIADIQAKGISSKKGSELPQHIKPSVPLAEHNDSERKPARPLPVDALPTGDRMRETSEALTAGIEAKMHTPMR